MHTLTSWNANPVQAFKEFVSTNAFAETGRRLRADGTLRVLSAESAKIYVSTKKHRCVRWPSINLRPFH
jgi:integrase/recombinase XerD